SGQPGALTGYRPDVDPAAEPESAWLALLPYMAPDELRSVLGEEGAVVLNTKGPELVRLAAWNRPEAREAVAEVLVGLHGPPWSLLPYAAAGPPGD
ncbi:MAG: hypothetical protein QNK03_22720, partial [Myxococcota bacterium]|nr:hypothetical protein [Myxococcota bacterium]